MATDSKTTHSQTSPAWTIRAYQPGDEHALVALFARVFGRSITEAHWLWKLKGRPSPVENVWLAVHDDRPIFQYAGIPVHYRLPNGERHAMVSVDTMTDPHFQRRGLLTQVGQYAYDAWRAAGVSFVIGLPNQRWGSRTGALGWVELFPLQWLVRPLRPASMIARRVTAPAVSRFTPLDAIWNSYWTRRSQHDATIHIRPVTDAGPEFDALWQAACDGIPISVVRDSAWVAWRYLNPPSFDYRLLLAERAGQPVGYAAYRLDESSGRKVGALAELFVGRDDVKARDMFVRRVVEELRAAGAEVVATLAVPGAALYRAFRRAGFFPRAAFSVQIVPLQPDLPMEILRDPQQWSLAGGDFDVI